MVGLHGGPGDRLVDPPDHFMGGGRIPMRHLQASFSRPTPRRRIMPTQCNRNATLFLIAINP